MLTSRLLCGAAISFSFIASVVAEKPFVFENTPGKLPKEVVPEEYAVRIAPNVQKLTFEGSETIKLNVRQPVRELVLNSADIEIASASVDDKPLAKSAIALDAKDQTLKLSLGNELSTGTHTLALKFSGKINDAGFGLYRAPYQEYKTGAKKTMLGTQFEATDARRMFPCWDEPSFRARFQMTAAIPENWTAVSNMPVEKETKIAGGKELHFAMSPPMASYLNVLCAGELDMIEKRSSGVQHRVVTTRGKAELGRYALDSAAQIVEYYNDYFGVPFPLPKLDEIAKRPSDNTQQLRDRIKDLTPLEEEIKKLERERTDKARMLQSQLQQKDKMMPNEVPQDGPAKELTKALADNKLFGAGLDVFDQEPPPPDLGNRAVRRSAWRELIN
jgi:aminopeptidase N